MAAVWAGLCGLEAGCAPFTRPRGVHTQPTDRQTDRPTMVKNCCNLGASVTWMGTPPAVSAPLPIVVQTTRPAHLMNTYHLSDCSTGSDLLSITVRIKVHNLHFLETCEVRHTLARAGSFQYRNITLLKAHNFAISTKLMNSMETEEYPEGYWRLDANDSYSDFTIVAESQTGEEDDNTTATIGDAAATAAPAKTCVYHVHRSHLSRGPRYSGYFRHLFENDNFRETKEACARFTLSSDMASEFPAFLDYLYGGIERNDPR
jgi:hypothetical protein